MSLTDQTQVPCNQCIECCKTNQGLFLHPELGDEIDTYQVRIEQDRQGNPVHLLATTPTGACVYLGPSGCTIYDRRPVLCRTFDCRKHYLILPREDRDNLVRIGLSSRAVFNAGRVRQKTLSQSEKQACLAKREEYFS